MAGVFYGDLNDPSAIRITDNLSWVPHHGWDDETDQIDAQLVTADRRVVGQLDIWAAEHPETADTIEPQLAAAARATWDAGSVLTGKPEQFGCTSLLVPGQLSRATVSEALRRFHP